MSTFTFLGTGSCEGIPAPFCSCELCNFARKHGGKDQRRRFSVLVDNDLVVDFGPDAAQAFRQFNIDDTKIKYICFTHSHCDHFCPMDLRWRAGLDTVLPMIIAGNANIKEGYVKEIAWEFRNNPANCRNNAEIIEAVPGKRFAMGEYGILPIKASHIKEGECALNYQITTPAGKKLLILADTGWWSDESFELVRGEMADVVISELSCGIHPGEDVKRDFHMGAKAVFDFIEKLKAQRSVKPEARCYTAHISHVPKVTQQGYEEYFTGSCVTPGYDGLTVEF